MKIRPCPIELAVEKREGHPPAPFYHTITKTGKPTKEMKGTRTIIFTLAKEGKPMTVHAISKSTDMPRANVGKYCKQLKKAGVVKAEELKQPSQSYWPYSLTYEGRLVALAIDLSMEHGGGLDRKRLTRELVEQMPFATPFHKFAQKTYLAFLEHGREDIVQEWLKRVAEAVFRDGATDAFIGAWMAVSGFNVGDKVALKVIDEAFSKLTRKDLLATKFYLKYALQTSVIEEIVKQSKGTEFFKEAEKADEDPNVFFMPLKCGRCGYYDPHRALTVREMLACYITNRSPVCTNCRMWTKLDIDEKEHKERAEVKTRIRMLTKPSTAALHR